MDNESKNRKSFTMEKTEKINRTSAKETHEYSLEDYVDISTLIVPFWKISEKNSRLKSSKGKDEDFPKKNASELKDILKKEFL